MIEHHKENYEAEVAAELMAEAAYQRQQPAAVVGQSGFDSGSSLSSSEWSSISSNEESEGDEGEEDGLSSSLYSDDLMGGDKGEMATPTLLPIDFDIEMDVEYTDDIYDSSDSESSLSSEYVLP